MRVIWEAYKGHGYEGHDQETGCARPWWDVRTSSSGWPEQHCLLCDTALSMRGPT